MQPTTHSKLQPIGLDLSLDTVRMIQFEQTGQSLRVVAAASQMLDSCDRKATDLINPQMAETVQQLLRGGTFRGRRAIVPLPRQILHVKNLRLPPMPAAELGAVVNFESRNIFPFEEGEARIEFLPAGEVRQGNELRQEVIVVAAKHKDIDRFVGELHNLGLIVDSLDIEPCALYRVIERFVRRREDEQEVHVAVDFGALRTQVLIGKGRDISFFKSIDTGSLSFNQAVSRKLGITVDEARALRRRLQIADEKNQRDPVRQAVSDAIRSQMEELGREISMYFRYYSVTFRGQRPARVRLFGDEALDPQLTAILNATLGVPVEAGRPLFNLNCAAMDNFDPTGPSANWALATGLALKRTTGSFVPRDGTPRAEPPPLAAETPELVTVIGNSAAAHSAPSPAPQGHSSATRPPANDGLSAEERFAAVRRAASIPEVANA